MKKINNIIILIAMVATIQNIFCESLPKELSENAKKLLETGTCNFCIFTNDDDIVYILNKLQKQREQK